MNVTGTNATGAATTTPVDNTGSSDIGAQQNDATGTPAPIATGNISAGSATPSAKVSLSAAAQAYLSQPDPPSVEEVQRAKKKPKIKTLLDMMLEWGKKYEEQRDQQQQAKQLAASQGVAASHPILTTNSPKKLLPGQPVGGPPDSQ